MFVSLEHGQIVSRAEESSGAEFTNIDGSTAFESAMANPSNQGRFGYYFSGDGLPLDEAALSNFDLIAQEMVDDGNHPGPTGLEAILTYFGQFVAHDITINTDPDERATQAFSIAPTNGVLIKNSRDRVVSQIRNVRKGTLGLDSLYGDDTPQDGALRDGAKMRIGITDAGNPNDLPRFAAMPREIQQLLDSHQPEGKKFFPSQAVIGDGRNDENLIVAQLHLAFLRFHNAVVDTLDHNDPDSGFAEAAGIVRRYYQWLVVERYLSRVCDPQIVDLVKRKGAPLYFEFANGEVTSNNAPMPLEFSVAGFRFGHSMIRPEYTFNDNFGPDGSIARASLREMFRFTGHRDLDGNGPGIGFPGATQLADVWVIDWNNFLDTGVAALNARPVDTSLADGLHQLFGKPDALKSLPARNLRRSLVLNIPTAQQSLSDLNMRLSLWDDELSIEPLTDDEIISSSGGARVAEFGYLADTPLWFYILAESEKRGGNSHLGPLGSLIVAETLIGLLVQDPTSYWNREGTDNGRWHPRDEKPGGQQIDSFETLLRFAGVM